MRYSYRIFIVCICFALISGCSSYEDQLSTGDTARDFRLNTHGRERFYLNKHKGKVVVLVFWATWCVICKNELVDLKSYSRMVKEKELVVAGICTDPENNNNLHEIIKNLEIDYPTLLDKGSEVYSKYNIKALPTTIILDRESRVSLIREGYNSTIKKQIESKVDRLLYQ